MRIPVLVRRGAKRLITTYILTITRLIKAILFLRSRFHASAHRETGFITWLNSLTAFSSCFFAISHPLLVGNSWVEEAVENVDHKIRNDENNGIDNHFSHYERIIPIQSRLDKGAPDSRYKEDRFYDYRAYYNARKGWAKIGDYGKQSSLKNVFPHYNRFFKPFCSCRADVIRTQHFEDACA